MNVPPNTRKFDINLAQQSHPLVTRDGRPAKFIAYVPDVIAHHQLIVQINDEVVRYNVNGKLGPYQVMDNWDLFLAPLGYCEGKPVFVNDVLISKRDNLQYPAEIGHENFSHCKWPSKAPVVETRMTDKELELAYCYGQQKLSSISEGAKCVANKAIERAILDGDVVPVGHLIANGDVIPTSVVKNMLLSAHGDRNNITCEHMAQIAIDKYLGGL